MLQEENNLYEFGGFCLDTSERALYRNGERIPLTPKAVDTLLVLVRDAGHVVSKEELLQKVWPDTFVEEGNLNVNIFALRKALGDSSHGHAFIETVPRRGFRFAAPVQIKERRNGSVVVETRTHARIVTEEISESAGDFTPGVQPLGHPALPRALPSPAVRRWLPWLLPLASLAVLSSVLAWVYASKREVHDVDSIAVLPLTNVGGDPKMEFLADGITEDLINNLSQLPNFKVVSRASAFHYKGKEISPRQIAQDLSVHALVTGRVVQQDSELLISVELADAEHDRQIWGRQYQEKMSNVLTLQSKITQQIADHLTLQMTGAQKTRMVRLPTTSPEAYELYLKGRYYWTKRGDSNLRKALDYFNQAIEKDSNYALAYSGLASSYDLLGEYSLLAPGEAFTKARSAASKALELDDSLGEAHAAMGNILMDQTWDFPSAQREYGRAIELNPSFASAHQWYAELLSKVGRHDEAIAEARKGKELDPLALQVSAILGQIYLYAGQLEAAEKQTKYVIELDSNFAFAHYVLGQIYAAQGRFAEAIGELQKVAALEPVSNRYRGYLGYVYARAGNTAEARKILAGLLEESKQKYIPWAHVAVIYAGLRETDRALTALEQAYQLRDPDMVGLKVDPAFDSLHSDPRFQELIRRVER